MVVMRTSSSLAIASMGDRASAETPSSGYRARRNHVPVGAFERLDHQHVGDGQVFLGRHGGRGCVSMPKRSREEGKDTDGAPAAQSDHGLQRSFAAVLDGSICPDGIDLTCTVAHPSEIFWRQLHFQEFDVSEMSLSSLLMAMAQATAIGSACRSSPRGAFSTSARGCARTAASTSPADLKGKRVGVPEYQQTAALWSRGVLKHEFGVEPRTSSGGWSAPRSAATAARPGFNHRAGMRFNRIPGDDSIGTMLVDGRLDATLLYFTDNNLVDRSRITLRKATRPFELLFPDPVAEGRRYYAKTGIFPINHGMVVRRSIYEQASVGGAQHLQRVSAGQGAGRTRGCASCRRRTSSWACSDLTRSRRCSVDAYPYGVKSNRKVLETVADYSYEQGLTPRRMKLEEIFAESTLDL